MTTVYRARAFEITKHAASRTITENTALIEALCVQVHNEAVKKCFVAARDSILDLKIPTE